MNDCLNERALLRVYTHEGTPAELSHLRLCADCAEYYERLTDDLETIEHVLQEPPAVSEIRAVPWRRWIPAAAACTAVMALVIAVMWLRQPAPLTVAARSSTVSAFAADLSTALFATSGTNAAAQLAADAPYLEAALNAGQPCTRDQVFTGECTDPLSAFVVEGE
jgi:hypothetical protein